MVEEDSVALGLVEGGTVGVVDEDLELKGDVEFNVNDGKGDAGEPPSTSMETSFMVGSRGLKRVR